VPAAIVPALQDVVKPDGSARLEIVTAALPVLAIVTDSDALDPIGTEPKSRLPITLAIRVTEVSVDGVEGVSVPHPEKRPRTIPRQMKKAHRVAADRIIGKRARTS
jgi:hypothetical protein